MGRTWSIPYDTSVQVRPLDELARLPDDAVDLLEGAIAIARDEYAGLDAGALVRELDALAEPLLGEELSGAAVEEQATRLCEHIHGSLGFRGNDADYGDPKNSYVSDVLARRTGIPISLALVYTEVARRVGVQARGVGFPSHFLVRVDDDPRIPEPGAVIDPFHGRVLDGRALLDLARRALPGPPRGIDPRHLAPAPSRAVLVRMLSNLKIVYRERGDLARAHLAVTRIIALVPPSAQALLERAELGLRLGATESAREDLERAAALDPRGPVGGRATELLQKKHERAAPLN